MKLMDRTLGKMFGGKNLLLGWPRPRTPPGPAREESPVKNYTLMNLFISSE